MVDGQQRTLALSRTKNTDIPVPVIGFTSPDLGTKTTIHHHTVKPLPSRLINELLPEVNKVAKGSEVKKLPSELCNMLNVDQDSPFTLDQKSIR